MSSEFRAAADAIGERLERAAIWHRGQCSWMGAETDRRDPWRIEYRPLGGDVYGGTAGVGLFLAHLGRRAPAAGALRHAVARPVARDGLHAGVLGIAAAAVQGGRRLGDDALVAAGHGLVASAEAPAGPADVVNGTAGAVLGLLSVGHVPAAVTAGERLLDRAVRGRHGWGWKTPGHGYARPLCGLAHGAAGIGWALLELFAATGDERFRTGGERALEYEHSWLDAQRGTWPDHRLGGYVRGRRHPIASPALGTWCHGEAGIALTRLRARELLGDAADHGDLEHALEATRRHVRAALECELTDASLCHGLAGSADVLLRAGDAELAREVGRGLLERHPQGDWPCAEPLGITPGLFRGLAGIGWFMLRLDDPGVPSPLMFPAAVDRRHDSA
jgi:class II lanthipeptide synthase